ncbi:hypothetical protein [Lysobacter olei]
MSSTLTAADAAQALSQSLERTPDVPVVIHWQLSDFPVEVARQLLDAGHAVAWVYPSAERGNVAAAALKSAGIAVRRHFGANEAVAHVTGIPTKYLSDNIEPFEQPRVDPDADRARRANLTERDEARLKALCELADMPMGAPSPGCVTLMSLGMLMQPGIIGQVKEWASPMVVLDHVTSLNVRWKDVRDGFGDFASRVVTQPPEKYAPARLLAERIPQVYVMRDEWACQLVSAHFSRHGVTVAEVATDLCLRKDINISVFSTDLVHAGFDTTTFLSIALRGDSGQQLVGQGIFGAFTPDSLSMSGERPLSRAVVKVTHPRDEEAAVMRLQVKVPRHDYSEIRARDHVRAALLAIGENAKNPEIVVLVSPTLARSLGSLTGVDPIRLGHWGRSNHSKSTTPLSVAPKGTKFQHSVLEAMLNQLDTLTDGRRHRKMLALLAAERDALPAPRMAMRLARLAHCLTHFTWDRSLDLAARDEVNLALSDNAKRATHLFSGLLDHLYPWKLSDKDKDAKHNLGVRQRVFALYQSFRVPKT